MNSAWLLKSSTLWGALAFSGLVTTFILLFSPDGLPSLRKRQAELREYQVLLLQKITRNRELAQEVHRLSTKDPGAAGGPGSAPGLCAARRDHLYLS